MLELIELVISAAKAEALDEELRFQTILAFKANPTTQRWDQVRNITPEEEWEKVKQDLVVYVIQQNTNPVDKVELLLKDGLYKQVIEVFPKPSGQKRELDLLIKVYTEIENEKPEVLEHLIPVVARYMKRYFQEMQFKTVYPILDRLQKRFPSMIINLYTKATEMLLFNLLQSQYSKFVQMFKDLKARMESINRQDDWNNFLSEFKRVHKGKQKLIQMVSLIGDSSWNLDAVMQSQRSSSSTPSKKTKREDDSDEYNATDSMDTEPPVKKPPKKKKRYGK